MTEEKREKVIKGLECCLTDSPSICEGCPYLETGCLDDIRHFKHDILLDCLALLKAQEPIAPVEEKRRGGYFRCGNCNARVSKVFEDKYCSQCGRPVKWE